MKKMFRYFMGSQSDKKVCIGFTALNDEALLLNIYSFNSQVVIGIAAMDKKVRLRLSNLDSYK